MSTGTYNVRNISARTRQRIRAMALELGITTGELVTKLINEEFENEGKKQERKELYRNRIAKLHNVQNDPDYFFCIHCTEHYMLCGCTSFKSVSNDVTWKVRQWRTEHSKKLGHNSPEDV